MSRKTISVPEDVFEAAKDAKQKGETWPEYLLRCAETDAQDGEGQTERQVTPLTADDVSYLAREVADEVETRMTRR